MSEFGALRTAVPFYDSHPFLLFFFISIKKEINRYLIFLSVKKICLRAATFYVKKKLGQLDLFTTGVVGVPLRNNFLKKNARK